MASLSFKTIKFPSAELFSPNPYFQMDAEDVHQSIRVDDSIPKIDCAYIGKGFRKNCLPYLEQNHYSREVKDRPFKVAVLENASIKATFSMEYGGRLLSLFNKVEGKELLSVNPCFQPAHLAIRNAWFSGGVEWNIGVIGHTPFTCSPLYVAKVQAPEGYTVLRMYEWERVRETPFQIDFYLKDDLPYLFVKVKIVNPNDVPCYMYWWSNIAVEEREDVRMLVPADYCYRFGYEGIMKRIETPLNNGEDYSYTTNLNLAMDYFFRLEDQKRRWICSLGGDGKGLVQTSTDRLKGRKLFVWGQSVGGDNWQDFLSHGQSKYIEIQAGLGLTQTEHIPMPPGEWSWLEAYGMLESDPVKVHGDDWEVATEHVNQQLEKNLSRKFLDEEHERATIISNSPIDEIIQKGSFWGALENERRLLDGESAISTPSMQFQPDESLDYEVWNKVLNLGTFDSDYDVPVAPLKGEKWIEILESAEKDAQGYYQLGILYFEAELYEKAKVNWVKSIEIEPSAFSFRSLAVISLMNGDVDKGLEYYEKAYALRKDIDLLLEYLNALNKNKHEALCLKLIAESPLQNNRLFLAKGYAHLGLCQFKEVESILHDNVHHEIIDLKEGELGFEQLWNDYYSTLVGQQENLAQDSDEVFQLVQEKYPTPKHFTYRMIPPIPPSERKRLGI